MLTVNWSLAVPPTDRREEECWPRRRSRPVARRFGFRSAALPAAVPAAPHDEGRLRHFPAQPFQSFPGLLRPALGQDHGELLPAVPESRGAEGRPDLGGHPAQGMVALRVPIGVVHRLEMIDIDHGQAIAPGQGPQGVLEGAPVADAGELVLEGPLPEQPVQSVKENQQAQHRGQCRAGGETALGSGGSLLQEQVAGKQGGGQAQVVQAAAPP